VRGGGERLAKRWAGVPGWRTPRCFTGVTKSIPSLRGRKNIRGDPVVPTKKRGSHAACLSVALLQNKTPNLSVGRLTIWSQCGVVARLQNKGGGELPRVPPKKLRKKPHPNHNKTTKEICKAGVFFVFSQQSPAAGEGGSPGGAELNGAENSDDRRIKVTVYRS